MSKLAKLSKLKQTNIEAKVKGEETKAEETKAEETKVEDTKAEETKVEETKVEETKAEETKAKKTKKKETIEKETISSSIDKNIIALINNYVNLSGNINRSDIVSKALVDYIEKNKLKRKVKKLLIDKLENM